MSKQPKFLDVPLSEGEKGGGSVSQIMQYCLLFQVSVP